MSMFQLQKLCGVESDVTLFRLQSLWNV